MARLTTTRSCSRTLTKFSCCKSQMACTSCTSCTYPSLCAKVWLCTTTSPWTLKLSAKLTCESIWLLSRSPKSMALSWSQRWKASSTTFFLNSSTICVASKRSLCQASSSLTEAPRQSSVLWEQLRVTCSHWDLPWSSSTSLFCT